MIDELSSLWFLFTTAFLSSTLLPGGSEANLVYLLSKEQHSIGLLISVATLGNTLGGMTNYIIGRYIPQKKGQSSNEQRAMKFIHKYGYITLLFSWLPIIGDPLCLVAGWLRYNPLICFLLIAIGKAIRYSVLAVLVLNTYL